MDVWQVARAAYAVPLLLKPFDGPPDPQDGNTFHRFIDGGLHRTNNPTWEGIQEVQEINGQENLGIVLSVGTARTNAPPGQSLKEEVRSIVDLANDPKDVHEEVQKDLECESFSYYRFNDPRGTDVDMDECEPKRPRGSELPGSITFKKIRARFFEWLSNDQEIQTSLWKCATQLVQQRRERIKDPGLWETFSTGSE